MSKLVIEEATHTYTLDGVRLPSVTQIINRVLPYDFNASEWHMQRGSATHRACELLDNASLDWLTVDPEILPRVKAWEAFRRDMPMEIVAVEERLAHSGLRYAGTLDRIFRRDGKMICADIKNSVSAQVKIQLAFYSLLWTHNKKQTIDSAVAVGLTEDGAYRCHWMTHRELRMAERQALAVLTTYNFAVENNLLEKR
jgi:hypothetical protein